MLARLLVASALLISVQLSVAGTAAANTNQTQDSPGSLGELRQQLDTILQKTRTPGASVAIVHRDGPEWVAGLGMADIAAGREATADTLFRIGSTSKAFTSLAILMLVDQGKLSLDDFVHKLAPEVWFENRWEATDPVRVVHLLEHTTGWDEMHLREFAEDAPDLSLAQALDYDHHSRVSRWPPGTRFAYCNSGPAVAAYIVEKLTGQRFEDFVEQNLFRPIGMKTATYFRPAPETAASLYRSDGNTPYSYGNIIYRPSGSINASAEDMAPYIQLYLNRGRVNGTQIVPASDIDRMETPTSSWAAKAGMTSGYGLSNYAMIFDGFAYRGHDGGVEGGLTQVAYMPQYGVGYFFSINSGSGQAFQRIGKAIRAYITRDLAKPVLPAAVSLSSNAVQYAGWYEPMSPRFQFIYFLERLIGIGSVRMKSGQLLLSRLGQRNAAFVPIGGDQFRYLPPNAPAEPVPTLELLPLKQEGKFLQILGTTMKHIPAWMAFIEIILTLFVLLSIVSILVYAPFWIVRGIGKKRRRPAERQLRLWPLIAVLCIISIVAIFILGSDDLISRLGNLTWSSAALCALIVAFAASSLGSAYAVWRARRRVVRYGVYTYSLVVTLALLIATAYFAYWHIIGLRTWT
jgi:CubicO group peptidase (beta-lactamase class C family)